MNIISGMKFKNKEFQCNFKNLLLEILIFQNL